MLMVLLLSLVCSACTISENFEQDMDVFDSQQYLSETVYIGVVMPDVNIGVDTESESADLAARAATYSRIRAAHEVAVDIINNSHDLEWSVAKNSGIAGYGASTVELVYADWAAVSQSVMPALDAAGRLIDLGVVALLGAYEDEYTLTMANRAKLKGVPLISGAGQSAVLTSEQFSWDHWVNRIAPTPKMDLLSFFEHIKYINQTSAEHINKVAIIYNSDDYSQEVLAAFNELAEEYKLTVAARVDYESGAQILTEEALDIITSGAQVVFHACSVDELKQLVQIYGEAKCKFQMACVCNSAYHDASFVSAVKMMETTYWCGTTAAPMVSNDEEWQNSSGEVYDYINSLYKEKTGINMDSNALYEFASVIVAAQAIGAGGSSNGVIMTEQLEDMVFEAPYLNSGSISFSDFGQNEISPQRLTFIGADGISDLDNRPQ